MTAKVEINKDIGIPLDKFLEDNINLIWKVTHRFSYTDKEELFQEASIYFIEAYKRFDASKNVKFASFAFNYMYKGIQLFLRDRSRTIRIPRSYHSVWLTMVKNDWNKNNLEEIVKEVHSKYGLSRNLIEEAVKAKESYYQPSSIDRVIHNQSDNDQGTTVVDMVGYHDYDYSFIECIVNIESILSKKEATIVKMLMLELPQSDISKHLGVSQSNISKTLTKIRKKLKLYMPKLMLS